MTLMNRSLSGRGPAAGDERTAGADVKLRCLTIGPRSGGRDYGVPARFTATPLPDRTSGPLGDFALALLEWGFEPRAPFAGLFPLGPRHYFLVRAAFLRREAYGPVVLANGLLLDGDAAAAVGGRVPQLLDVIKDPLAGEWDRLEIDLDAWDIPAAEVRPSLVAFCRSFRARVRGEPVLLEVADGSPPEQVISEILEGSLGRHSAPISWSTSWDLGRVGSFEPGKFDLIVMPAAPGVPPSEEVRRLDEAGVSGPPIPESQSLRVLVALVGAEPIRADAGMIDGSEAVARLLAELLVEEREEPAFWGRIKDWAAAARDLPDKDDSAFGQLAIAIAFRLVLERCPTPEDQARLLAMYIRGPWSSLPDGPLALPASLALRLNLLPHLDSADLEWLACHGLATSFAMQTSSALGEARLHGSQLAALARAVEPGLSSGGAAGAWGLAKNILLSAARPERAPGTTDDERQLLETGRTALIVAEAAAEWRMLSQTLATMLAAPLDEEAASPLLQWARGSIASAFQPPNATALRGAWTAVELAKRANRGIAV